MTQATFTAFIANLYNSIDWFAVCGGIMYVVWIGLCALGMEVVWWTWRGVRWGVKSIAMSPYRIRQGYAIRRLKREKTAKEAELKALEALQPSWIGRSVLLGLESPLLEVSAAVIWLNGAFTLTREDGNDKWTDSDGKELQLTHQDRKLVRDRMTEIRTGLERTAQLKLADRIAMVASGNSAKPTHLPCYWCGTMNGQHHQGCSNPAREKASATTCTTQNNNLRDGLEK
jgi:hypothetical protein